MSHREWHYHRGGREWGPLTFDELSELVEEGEVEASVLVRRADQQDWLPLVDVVVMDDSAPPVPVLAADGPIPISYARPGGTALNFNYASFMMRGGAFLLDLVVLALVVNGLELLMALLQIDTRAVDDFGAFVIVLSLWLYYAIMESSAKQASIGKLAVGIYVVDMRGDRISFGRATGRFFAKYLSALPLYMGFLSIAWSEKSQGCHDMIAGTLVVRK